MTFDSCRNDKSLLTVLHLSSFLLYLDCTGVDVNLHILYDMLRDILFYIYLLMALPLLAAYYNKLMDWLWWYPPRLRRMRIFRLRRFVGFFAVWTMMVMPIMKLYERNRGPDPLLGFQRASSGGSILFQTHLHAWLTRPRVSRRG